MGLGLENVTENSLPVSNSDIHIVLDTVSSFHPQLVKLAKIPASHADQPRTLQKSSTDQARNEAPLVQVGKWGISCLDQQYHSSSP